MKGIIVRKLKSITIPTWKVPQVNGDPVEGFPASNFHGECSSVVEDVEEQKLGSGVDQGGMSVPVMKQTDGWLHSSKPNPEETGSSSMLDQVQSNANSEIGSSAHSPSLVEKESPSDPTLQPQRKLGVLEVHINIEPEGDKDKTRSISDFEDRCLPGGRDSVILYTTSLRGIRKTFEDCNTIRFLLDSFRVMYSERDVSMHLQYREELWRILGNRVVPPRLFIRGRYVGGADEVVELHEKGMLQNHLQGIPLSPSNRPCNGCAGMRFVLCSNCNGSQKVMPEGLNKEPSIRCPDCNENGLVKCSVCSED